MFRQDIVKAYRFYFDRILWMINNEASRLSPRISYFLTSLLFSPTLSWSLHFWEPSHNPISSSLKPVEICCWRTVINSVSQGFPQWCEQGGVRPSVAMFLKWPTCAEARRMKNISVVTAEETHVSTGLWYRPWLLYLLQSVRRVASSWPYQNS